MLAGSTPLAFTCLWLHLVAEATELTAPTSSSTVSTSRSSKILLSLEHKDSLRGRKEGDYADEGSMVLGVDGVDIVAHHASLQNRKKIVRGLTDLVLTPTSSVPPATSEQAPVTPEVSISSAAQESALIPEESRIGQPPLYGILAALGASV